MELTRRQRIRELLVQEEWTLEALAKVIDVPKGTIIDDLEHISRSVGPRQRLTIIVPGCEACGFQFKQRSRFTNPSRCPRCKNEHLAPQTFRIV